MSGRKRTMVGSRRSVGRKGGGVKRKEGVKAKSDKEDKQKVNRSEEVEE